MIQPIASALLFIIPQSDPAVAPPAAPAVATAIRDVTVYPTEALVTRAGKVATTAKQTRFEVAELPNELRDESIRVRAIGGANKSVVVGVDVITKTRAASGAASVEELRKRRAEQERERAGLADQIAANASLQQFIDSLRTATPKAIGQSLTNGGSGPSPDAIYQFVSERLPKVLGELRKLRDRDAQVAAEMAQVDAKLSQLQSGRVVPVKSVFVDLLSANPGDVEFELSYLIGGAGWSPSYDIRANENLKSADLLMYGVVAQRTGEDWKQIQLTFSTSKPERGAQAPVAQPDYLSAVEREPAIGRAYAAKSEVRADARHATKEKAKDGKDLDKFSDEAAPAESPAPVIDATIASSGLATQLKVPRNEDVPADGRPHRVHITEIKLQLEPLYTTIPKLMTRAFVRAKPKNIAGFPILAGTAQVFAGSDFVGRSSLAETQIGEPIDLSLGADPGITIERIKDKGDREAPGFFGSRVTWTFTYRVILKNTSAATGIANIEVTETVPVSRDDRIKVDIANSDPPFARGEKEDKDRESKGQVKWNLALARGESKTIIYTYTVSAPENINIDGVEK
ncbi:MAG: mucoidy inhibitor MuiA family protein [Planctomycetes bacterium]|nr:mucoidy inhibitor MuiA family protein [Planctomycetota bacterium]